MLKERVCHLKQFARLQTKSHMQWQLLGCITAGMTVSYKSKLIQKTNLNHATYLRSDPCVFSCYVAALLTAGVPRHFLTTAVHEAALHARVTSFCWLPDNASVACHTCKGWERKRMSSKIPSGFHLLRKHTWICVNILNKRVYMLYYFSRAEQMPRVQFQIKPANQSCG